MGQTTRVLKRSILVFSPVMSPFKKKWVGVVVHHCDILNSISITGEFILNKTFSLHKLIADAAESDIGKASMVSLKWSLGVGSLAEDALEEKTGLYESGADGIKTAVHTLMKQYTH